MSCCSGRAYLGDGVVQEELEDLGRRDRDDDARRHGDLGGPVQSATASGERRVAATGGRRVGQPVREREQRGPVEVADSAATAETRSKVGRGAGWPRRWGRGPGGGSTGSRGRRGVPSPSSASADESSSGGTSRTSATSGWCTPTCSGNGAQTHQRVRGVGARAHPAIRAAAASGSASSLASGAIERHASRPATSPRRRFVEDGRRRLERPAGSRDQTASSSADLALLRRTRANARRPALSGDVRPPPRRRRAGSP